MANFTLLIHHLFTGIALALMMLRLWLRRTLFRHFNLGDYLTMVAIICAAARDALIHVVLTWGTNNISAKVRAHIDFTPEEIYHRTIGSKFTITNRPIYNTYLWLQKFVLLHFYLTTFHPDTGRGKYILWSYSFILVATWIPAQIVGFTECNPFHLYWQVVPPPGRCAEAQVQLMVLGILSIVTDVMLLALPLPVLISLRTPLWTKVRLCILCMLGLLIIAVTIIRLPINVVNASVQANRTLWASVEMLAAAIVVNAPVIYGSCNRWRQQSTYSSSSRQDNFSNRPVEGGTGRSTARFPTNPTNEGPSPLCIYSQTTVTTESTHHSKCTESQEGILMTTIETSMRDPDLFLQRIEESLRDKNKSNNGK